MIINCPVCSGQLTITPQHFGHNVNCPHCTRLFQVPAAAPQATPQPQYPAQHAAPATPMASPVPPHLQQAAGPQATAYATGPTAAGQHATVAEANEAVARFREKRHKASSKMIVWVIALAVGIPAVIGLFVLLVVAVSSSKEIQEEKRIAQETRERAINMAKNNLANRGYTLQTRDIKVSSGKDTAVVTGRARKGEQVHDFKCKVRKTETDDRYIWGVEYLEIDGVSVVRK